MKIEDLIFDISLKSFDNKKMAIAAKLEKDFPCDRHFRAIQLKPSQNVKQREKDNPDDIDEVPVDFCHFYAGMFSGIIVTLTARSPQYAQD